MVGRLIAEAERFLEVIFEREDDDTPRLVYADWLAENGEDAHARLIRAQCEIARVKPFSDRANELWIEAGRAWRELQDQWWYEFQGLEVLDVNDFRRGFPREPWDVDDTFFCRLSENWWPRLPVRRVAVTVHSSGAEGTRRFAHLLLQKSIRHFVEFTLKWVEEEFADPREQQMLAECSHFASLERLDLKQCAGFEDSFQWLLDSPYLGNLRVLRVPIEIDLPTPFGYRLLDRFGEVFHTPE